jgi:hypothetical protein
MNTDELQRRARASTLFREVNDRIEDVSAREPGDLHEFLCECGDPLCGRTIVVTSATYRRARETQTRFLFSSWHAGDEGLEVIEALDGYLVAEIQ